MATVCKFTAQVDLCALLGRQIKVDRLVLTNVDLLVEKNRQGQANWDFAPPAAGAAAPQTQQPAEAGSSFNSLPVISDVMLKNVKLAYRDAQSGAKNDLRSEEHTSDLQSLMRISYAVFCLTKNNNSIHNNSTLQTTITTPK